MAKKSYVETILDELTQSGDVEAIELGNILAKTDISDKEMRQYINSGKGYYSRKWPNDLLAKMPTFRKALYSEPVMNNIKDLDKAFNDPNWDKEYIKGNIPEDQLDFIAEENGVSKERLKEIMNKEVTLRNRARDMDVDLSLKGAQNFITRAMFPRSTERYLKGDEIQGRDIALDAGENILYMVPYGFAANALTKGGRAATLTLGATNAINPTITEAADALVYSDDNENERSVFQPADVGKGTFINMATPYALLRGAGTAGRRYGFPNVGKRIEEFGTGTTARDLKNQWVKDVKMVNEQRANPNATPLKQKLDSKSIIESKDYKASLSPEHQSILTGEESLNGIIYQPGKSFDEKLANYNKNLENPIKKGTPEYEQLASEYEMWKPPEQIIQAENLKLKRDIIPEEMAKNYVTNKAGDLLYSDQPDKLTLIGRLFRKSPKTLKEEQEAKEYEDQLNYLYDKYKLPDYREDK
jgi:hypothetical protein